jgi:hypothetical protein
MAAAILLLTRCGHLADSRLDDSRLATTSASPDIHSA